MGRTDSTGWDKLWDVQTVQGGISYGTYRQYRVG